MERTRVWLAVSPLVATGVLVAHGLAYRLTGTPTGSVHEYLDHAPQVLFVLAVVGLAVAGLAARLRTPAAWPFATAAVVTFVVQEHLELLAHDGEVRWLLETPAFLVGILLQLPFALGIWALARRLLAALTRASARPRRISHLLLDVARPASSDVRPVPVLPLPGRGPPFLSRR